MKRKANNHSANITPDHVRQLWMGCHVCGTGESIYPYTKSRIFGYRPCRSCYKSDALSWDSGLFRLFEYLSRHYRSSISLRYLSFLYDDFAREQLRKIRKLNGIVEPIAQCSVCGRTVPLFDMCYIDNPWTGIRIATDGVVKGGFKCFECDYHEDHHTAKCYFCKREVESSGIRHHICDLDICESCYKIKEFDSTIKARRNRERIERQEWTIDTQYILSRLTNAGVESPNRDQIELYRQRLFMKRTLKTLKNWRKANEPDCDVISGKQHKDETVNEVNRGCEEARHGSDCRVSA